MSDAIEKTAAGATRSLLGALGFILLLLGLEMMTEKAGIQFGLGLFLSLLLEQAHTGDMQDHLVRWGNPACPALSPPRDGAPGHLNPCDGGSGYRMCSTSNAIARV